MKKEQQNYLIQQIRQHAAWTKNNVALTLPMAWTESEVAYKLGEDGYVINQRPITDVTLPPNAEMQENYGRYQQYCSQIDTLLGSYVNGILDGSKDNPSQILSEFVAAIAVIEV